MKVLALDYGSARTGVAVSDPTGTVARPLDVVKRARHGRRPRPRARARARRGRRADRRGPPRDAARRAGQQAQETERFVDRLRESTDLPVESFDERFTTALARQAGETRAAEDAVAAAHLLTSYLQWKTSARPA